MAEEVCVCGGGDPTEPTNIRGELKHAAIGENTREDARKNDNTASGGKWDKSPVVCCEFSLRRFPRTVIMAGAFQNFSPPLWHQI